MLKFGGQDQDGVKRAALAARTSARSVRGHNKLKLDTTWLFPAQPPQLDVSPWSIDEKDEERVPVHIGQYKRLIGQH